jgi:putative flippase GtrA
MQLSPEFLRFLAVGVLNTLFGYGLFALLSWIGLPYPVAIGLATVIGVAFNFQSTGRLVFGQAPLSRFARFVGVYAFLYLLNVAAVALLLHQGLNVYLANASAVVPLAMLAFLLQRRFVFPKA